MSTATAPISKNFITFGQWITSKKLSVNEQHLLNVLFRYHNCNYGYAFPTIKDLMMAFNTTSSNRILTTIKKLESKGLIRVNRAKKKNNTYLIMGIERFINNFVASAKKKEEKPKKKPSVKKSTEEKVMPIDSNGEIPLEGQVSFFDVVEEVKQEVKEATLEEVKEDSKVKKVLESFKDLKLSKKEKEIIAETDKDILNHAIDSITVEKINGTYFLEAINRAKRNVKNLVDGINPFKFNNFKAREYDWNSLEAKLLGWDNVEETKETREKEGVQLGIDWLGLEGN
ncbi:helix-turn-helix domain-containing protein [uncultured Clostridium sp.]|uniref:LexA family protein n=1 Tax=uncultured Clostridium sp. TaxID=59620 RepID=UPI002603BC7E|nr:helix-turn-helix domain-containing protein [uncultured Clostridium sp.]